METSTEALGRPRGDLYYAARIALAVGGLGALAAAGLSLNPAWALVADEPFVVQLHLCFAVLALALGAVQLAGRKGGHLHRVVGWFWVSMMAIVTIASLFIMSANPGRWSWIHITTLVHGTTLALAVVFAVRRNIKWHARLMTFTYVSGLVGALLLAFIPDRLMWQIFFAH
jgi:uncharacterized membrane protein